MGYRSPLLQDKTVYFYECSVRDGCKPCTLPVDNAMWCVDAVYAAFHATHCPHRTRLRGWHGPTTT